MPALLILALIIIIPFVLYSLYQGDSSDITEWVKDRGETVHNIEQRNFSTGPFILTKNYRIYYVKTSEETYWFRFGWGKPDIYSGENGDHQIQ